MAAESGPYLHEAIIVCMIRERASAMSTARLAELNKELQVYRKGDEGWPEPSQIFLRAREYPGFFEVEGTAKAATVRLRDIRVGLESPTVAKP
jgi:hypothetical protein